MILDSRLQISNVFFLASKYTGIYPLYGSNSVLYTEKNSSLEVIDSAHHRHVTLRDAIKEDSIECESCRKLACRDEKF